MVGHRSGRDRAAIGAIEDPSSRPGLGPPARRSAPRAERRGFRRPGGLRGFFAALVIEGRLRMGDGLAAGRATLVRVLGPGGRGFVPVPPQDGVVLGCNLGSRLTVSRAPLSRKRVTENLVPHAARRLFMGAAGDRLKLGIAVYVQRAEQSAAGRSAHAGALTATAPTLSPRALRPR